MRFRDLYRRFFKRDLFHAGRVLVQLLKETFAQTGEIDFACPSPSALAVNHPVALAVATGLGPKRDAGRRSLNAPACR
jgi:hypothetical protein